MLSGVLHLGVGVLREHLGTHTCFAGVMHDRHVRDVADLPTCSLHPQTEVGFLAVDEETLVEETGALERLASREHERPRCPIAFDELAVSIEFEVALTEYLDAKGKKFGSQALTECTEGVREVPDCRVDLPVRRQLDDSGETHIRVLVETTYQRFESPFPDLGVGVEEKDVSRVRRLHGAVVRMCEAAVDATYDAGLRKRLADERCGSVSRPVVGHHDVEGTSAPVIEDARQAGA